MHFNHQVQTYRLFEISRKLQSKYLNFFIMFLFLLQSESARSSSELDRWNLKASVLGTLAGFIITESDYFLSDYVSLGLGYSNLSVKRDNTDLKLQGAKLYLNYYFQKLKNDTYFASFYNGATHVIVQKIEDEKQANSDVQASTFGMRGGYHWWWQTLNLSLSYYLGINYISKVRVYDSLGGLVEEKPHAQIESGPELFLGVSF